MTFKNYRLALLLTFLNSQANAQVGFDIFAAEESIKSSLGQVCAQPLTQAAFSKAELTVDEGAVSSGVSRQEFIQATRQELRGKTLKKLVKLSFDLQKNVFVGVGKVASPKPANCAAIENLEGVEPGFFASLQDEQDQLSELVSKAPIEWKKLYFQLLSYAAYKVVLMEAVKKRLGSKLHVRVSSAVSKTGGQRTSLTALGRWIGKKSGAITYADLVDDKDLQAKMQQEIERTIMNFPILSRAANGDYGFKSQSVASRISELIQPAQYGSRMVAELGFQADDILDQALIELNTAGTGPAEKWLVLFAQIEKTLGLANFNYPRARPYIRQEMRRWYDQLTEARQTLCHGEADIGEYYRLALLSVLAEESNDKVTQYINIYCNHKWGVTRSKQIERFSEMAAVPFFLAGVASSTLAPYTLPVSSSILGAVGVIRSKRSRKLLALEEALYLTRHSYKRKRRITTHLSTALSALSAVYPAALGTAMNQTGGILYFLPYIKWSGRAKRLFTIDMLMSSYFMTEVRIKRGMNPISDKGYLIGLISTYLNSLAFSRTMTSSSVVSFFRRLGVGVSINFIVNRLTQSVDFLLNGQEPDPRIFQFSLNWKLKVSMASSVLLKSSLDIADWTIGASFPGSKPFVSSLITAMNKLYFNKLGPEVYMAFVENRDESFEDALKNGFKGMWENRVNELNAGDQNESEKLGRLIDVVKFYASRQEPGLALMLGIAPKVHEKLVELYAPKVPEREEHSVW